MIKIKNSYSQGMIDEYVDIMLPLIKQMYKYNVPSDTAIKNLFSSNSKFDEEKVKDILLNKESIEKYSQKYTSRQSKMITKIINYSLLEHSIEAKKWPFGTKNLTNLSTSPDSKDYWKKTDGLRHKLLVDLNCTVCPYCNRQYVTSYMDSKGKKKKTTADLDHFRPKSEYPLLALSLYNFVPSCQICNSRMKGRRTEETIYPYAENYGDKCTFKLEASGNEAEPLLKVMKGGRLTNDEILKFKLTLDSSAILDGDFKKRVENSKKVFHLEEVYQSHTKYAVDLLQKKSIYAEGGYKELTTSAMRNVGLLEPNQEITQGELDAFLYGFNWNDDGEDPDKPLSKLAYDIVKRK